MVLPSRRRILEGAATALGLFAIMGTVSALWPSPLFIRMTPAQGFEVPLLALLALLSGAFVAVRREACAAANRATGVGVLGYLGVACPTCNKILLLLFGGETLLAYFEPYRLHVTVAAIALMAWLVWREIRLGRSKPAPAS